MTAIRIRTTLTEPILRVPQLKSLMGKKVVIHLRAEQVRPASRAKTRRKPRGKPGWFTRNFGAGWPDAADDGFEEAVARWRREDRPRELPE